MSAPVFRAYVDESESRQDRDPGTYILSAAICEKEREEGLREAMATRRPASGGKLHWRSASTRDRAELAAEVSTLQVEHLVVVRLGDTDASSERRRRLCLSRMFFELAELGVTQMTAESRGAADDRRDRNLLDQLRAQRRIPTSLRLDHRPGPAEPLLWIPDVVAGAITRYRTLGTDLGALHGRLTLIEIHDR
jgi:hypothetical protein